MILEHGLIMMVVKGHGVLRERNESIFHLGAPIL